MDRKPEWLRIRVPSGARWAGMTRMIERRGLHTVCDSARCPNKAECWGAGTATFMILGDVCTRNCRFCAVKTGRTGTSINDDEARELAEAVAELKLSYAVLTSVDRDDLIDRGAGHFGRCVRAIKERNPDVRVEVLIPDYFGEELGTVLEAGPDTVAHNVETVRRLQGVRDARASYELSLRTLISVKVRSPNVMIKSSILLGLGETEGEIIEAFTDLRDAGCSGIVIGQYLRPTAAQVPVAEYVPPATFARYAELARESGFASVVSAPFARTSYHAMEAHSAAREQDVNRR